MQEEAGKEVEPTHIEVVLMSQSTVGLACKAMSGASGMFYDVDALGGHFAVFGSDSRLLHKAGGKLTSVPIRALWRKVEEMVKGLSGTQYHEVAMEMAGITQRFDWEQWDRPLDNEILKRAHLEAVQSFNQLAANVVKAFRNAYASGPMQHHNQGPVQHRRADDRRGQGSKQGSHLRGTGPQIMMPPFVPKDRWEFWTKENMCYYHSMMVEYPVECRAHNISCPFGDLCRKVPGPLARFDQGGRAPPPRR
jgi:hypothetical protein